MYISQNATQEELEMLKMISSQFHAPGSQWLHTWRQQMVERDKMRKALNLDEIESAKAIALRTGDLETYESLLPKIVDLERKMLKMNRESDLQSEKLLNDFSVHLSKSLRIKDSKTTPPEYWQKLVKSLFFPIDLNSR